MNARAGIKKIHVKAELPWPEDVWTSTQEETGKFMRFKMGDRDTTLCAGVMMRHGWRCCERAIRDALAEQGIILILES